MVITYSSTIKFVPECFITQEMCHEEVNRCLFVFDYIPDWYKTQDMCNEFFLKILFLTVYCRDEYITQKMCDEAIDDSMITMKLIPEWFVSSKITQNLFTAFYTDKSILYFDEGSANVVFSCNEMGNFNIDLKNITPDNKFDDDDPDTVIPVRLLP